MKSKSPFAMKSPLLAYKSDMKGNYANPEYVPETIVGAEIGANIAKTAASVFDSYANSKKSAQSDSKKAFDDLANTKSTKFDSGLNTDFRLKGAATTISGPKSNPLKGETFTDQHAWDSNRSGVRDDPRFQGEGGMDKFFTAAGIDRKNNGTGINTTYDGGKTRAQDNDSSINMKGSPVKHNAGAVGSIGNADPSAGGWAGIVQAASQGGSVVGSIGQQMGNQAQQRAAKLYTNRESNGPTAEAAGGMIGVTGSIGQDVLPPPNQVAETGSYGGGGDRILEMDSNPVGNQSIGRDTDVASQLFGSGQRASMLAMKGTPLHHDSEKQAHSHPTKTTTKMKPDGEYPGARYVKGDLVDQDDLLDKTKLDAHIATQVQSDKKGTFIKEKSDDGPGSDIETSKGFGKKIRLGSMGRSSYTSNMKDQLDPHNFLFQNTPKK